MKPTSFTAATLVAVVLMVTSFGCSKRPTRVTNIPNPPIAEVPDVEMTEPIEGIFPEGTNVTLIPLNPPDTHEGWREDNQIFRANTVLFGFDSSVIGNAEKPKVEAVAAHLKSNPIQAVRVEGHCDERGTEGYNMALGERRAIALREELIRLGVEPGRVDTISYGEERPANPAHNEEAWRQNRRGEFILLTPPL